MVTKRMTRDKMFMEMVNVISKRGTCKRAQVGCVIGRDGRIIVTGYNGVPSGDHHCNENMCNLDEPCERAIHAEANAIAFAAKEGIALAGTTIYTHTMPCLKCAELIVQSGIVEVVYGTPYRDDSGKELLTRSHVKCRTFII